METIDGKLVLNEVVNITDSSARLMVAQTPPPDGSAFEDRYYLTSSFIDVEPEDVQYKGMSDPAYDHVDIYGLPAGKQWYVQAWRRWPGDPARPHMKCTHGSGTTFGTKQGPVTVEPSFKAYRFNMKDLTDFNQTWVNRLMRVRCMHDDEMGDFIRLDITGDCNSAVITSRKRFNKDKPIIVRGKVRNTGGVWGALLLYNGEAEDMGISWGVVRCDIRYTVNLPWSSGDVGSMRDRVANFEFMYDGEGKIYYWVQFPGEPRRLMGTRDYKLITDPPVYFGAAKDKGISGWLDFGDVEVIGEETYGFSEGPAGWKSENGGVLGGTEWQHGYPQDGSEHYYAQAGYWSIARLPKGDESAVPNYDGLTMGVSRDQHSFPAGTARLTSPMIRPAGGYRYDTVRLIGSTRSGGELKIFVRDAAGKAIGELSQTGGLAERDAESGDEYFCPVYGVTQEVDLSGIEEGPIYFEAVVVNPNEGVTDLNEWSPPGTSHGEGTDTGAPCLKSLFVDFKPGNMAK